MRRGWLAGAAYLWSACNTPTEAPPPEVVEEVPTANTETFQVAGGMTAAKIAALVPAPPTRQSTTPVPLPPEDRYKSTAAYLEAFLKARAADPTNPWAIGHGMLALGPDFVLSNGRPAIDHVFETYAERFTVDGHGFVRFPTTKGSTRVEPHTGLMLKALTEIGVSPDRAVTVAGTPATVADLYRGVLVHASVDPRTGRSSFSSPNDMPWALQALATWAPVSGEKPDLRWQAEDGTQMSLLDLSMLTTSVLVAESQPLFDSMKAGAALEKRGQGVFKFTCGGAHMLQGAAYANARGFTSDLSRKGIQGQVPLMFWRLTNELQVYDDLMKRIDKEEHLVLLLVQRLKFTGHFLETMHKMAIEGYYTPDEQQLRYLQGAADQVVLTVKALESRGVFTNLDAIRARDEQLYLDVIGDSAHALRGLRLAMGTGQLAW